MRSLFRWCAVLVLPLLLVGCWKQPTKYNFANAAGAEQYERLMWQSVQTKKWKEVDSHLAPLFTGVTPDGQFLDHAEWMKYWKSAEINDLSLGEIAVRPNGADMVVTYVLRLNGAAAGRPFASAGLRIVSVWQQVKSGWIMTTQSATPVI